MHFGSLLLYFLCNSTFVKHSKHFNEPDGKLKNVKVAHKSAHILREDTFQNLNHIKARADQIWIKSGGMEAFIPNDTN